MRHMPGHACRYAFCVYAGRPGSCRSPVTMADDWEVVVPSRAVSPAPISLASTDASHRNEATASHAPATEEGSDLTVFAAPWATPTKPGPAGDDAAAPEQPLPEAEASRLGGSAVFVSPPPRSPEDGSPGVATPMQVAKPAMADSDTDPEADMVTSQLDRFFAGYRDATAYTLPKGSPVISCQ